MLRVAAGLPLPVLHGGGALIGWLLWLLPNSQKRVAGRNIQLCFPELSAAARRRLARRSLCHTAKTLLELGPLWLWPGERVLPLVRKTWDESDWRNALEQSGAIVLTPHLGAWELTGLYISSRYPLTALYRPSRAGPDFDGLVLKARERLGGRLVPTDSAGVRRLLHAVRNKQAAGILPDQDPGPEGGVFAPFFGHPANTMVLLSRIAIRCQAPVFIAYAERLPYGRGFHIHFKPLPEGIRQEPLERSVAVLNQAIEQAIRQIPEQYLWTYKRFKRRPPGLPKLYS